MYYDVSIVKRSYIAYYDVYDIIILVRSRVAHTFGVLC